MSAGGTIAVIGAAAMIIASLTWYAGRSRCPARFPTDTRLACALYRGHRGMHMTTSTTIARWSDPAEPPAVEPYGADDSGPPLALMPPCPHRRRRMTFADGPRVVCIDCECELPG